MRDREQPRATSASRVDPRALRVPMHARAAERAFHLAYAPYPIQLTVARKYTYYYGLCPPIGATRLQLHPSIVQQISSQVSARSMPVEDREEEDP